MADGEIVLVCGGTGGHLAPGIAMAQRFSEKGHAVLVVISRKPVDARMMEAYPDIPYVVCPGVAFSLRPMKLLRSLFHLFTNLWTAFHLIRRRKPESVYCFGGFLTPGFALSSVFFRTPFFVHEANRVPGRALRLFSRFATRVYAPEGITLPSVVRSRMISMGLPLRRESLHLKKKEARDQLNLADSAKILLVLGGSQGARSLNAWAADSAERLAIAGIQLLCVVGERSGDLSEKIVQSGQDHGQNHQVFTFHENIPLLLSASDIVLSRAGAGTIAEIVRTLTPSVLIPYPHAADFHQHANAHDLETRGAAVVLEEDSLAHGYSQIHDLLFNDWLLSKMRQNLKLLNRFDYGDAMYSDWAFVMGRQADPGYVQRGGAW